MNVKTILWLPYSEQTGAALKSQRTRLLSGSWNEFNLWKFHTFNHSFRWKMFSTQR